MMRAVLTIGLPGCGKSTYAATQPGLVELNLDALREVVAGDATNQHATPRAVGLRHRLMNHHAAQRDDLIVSDTNVRRSHRRRLIRALHRLGYRVELVFFNVGLTTCLRRNAGRDRVVPAEAIAQMAALIQAHPPRVDEADGYMELADPDDPLIPPAG
ncbi:MAG: ATP/GTP-binding protein [Cyanobacteria bacterium RYN_339]|nr:ATP/GTP-binding protein [Cyanobacteria bacterium RYN_339]